MRVGFFLREATRSLRRSAVPSFAAVATVLVTMLVLGVFIPVVQATTGAANEIRGKLLLDVYLKPDATKADAARVRRDRRSHPQRQERQLHLQGAGLPAAGQAQPRSLPAARAQPAAGHPAH